jgi:hypothetical protein
MNWLIKSDRPGHGPYVITLWGTYYARHDGSVLTWNDDNVSCFWPTYQAALTFLGRFRDAITANCLRLPGGPDPRFLVGSGR